MGRKPYLLLASLMALAASSSAGRSEPAQATPEFSQAFCSGWNSAAQLESQRAQNWRMLVTAARTEQGAQTEQGKLLDLLVNSVAAYVLINPLSGPVSLGDGRTVDCTPAPPKAAPTEGAADIQK